MIELEKKETQNPTNTELPLKEDNSALCGISRNRIRDYINGQEDPTIMSSPDFFKHVPLASFPMEVPILLESEWMSPNVITQIDANRAVITVSAEISREKWMTKREYNARIFSLRSAFRSPKALEYGISEVEFRFGPQSTYLLYDVPVKGSTVGEVLETAAKIIRELKDTL